MMRRFSLLFLLPVLGLAAACGGDPEPTKLAPQITSTPPTQAVTGEAFSYTVEVTGEPAPTVSTSELPEWLMLEGLVLSGTPAESDVGDLSVTLTATNGVEPDAVQTFTLMVILAESAPAFTSTPLTSATEGEPYTYSATAVGHPVPQITATTLPEWLQFENNELVGTPGLEHGGDHTVVLTAQNGIDPDAVQTFTITVTTVSEAPAFTSTPVTAATEGEGYSYTVAVSGHPAPTLSATTLPAWLNFDATTGVLSGTPAYEDGGDHEVVITAQNGIAPDATQAFTVSVATVSTAPSFTATAPTTATEGQLYTFTVTTSGTPAPAVTATTLPSWLQFDATSGVLSGTPGYADGGDHDVELVAQNGISPDATLAFSITVTTVSTAPQFTASAPTAATEGQLYTFTVTTSGTPAPTVTATTLPSWLHFDATTGVLSGTPAYADGGNHNVVLTAQNGISPHAALAFSITVTTVSTAPQFTASAPTAATEGQLYTFTATVSGMPAPALTATTLPSWLSFDATTGVLSGTPAYADGGSHNVVLTAQNGISPDATLAFTITVTTVSVPPAITSTAVTTVIEGTLYSYTVTATGTPAPALTAQGAAGAPLPAWLSFDGATGVLSGNPGPSQVGTHEVVITASNGIGQDATQAFSITVEPSEQPPLFTSAPVTSAFEGQLYSYTVTASGLPAPTLTAALAGGGALPSWLDFASATGVLSGTPGPSDLGTLQIEITADNGVAPSATQAFTLTVASPAIVITSTAPTTAQVGTLYSYTVTTSGSPAPAITVSGLPSWLTFDGTATLSGTPTTEGTTGTITVTASNGVSTDGTETFSVAVAPYPAIVVASGVYEQEFDTAAPPGWSTEGTGWGFGVPTVGSTSVGPPYVLDGAVAATNPTGDYSSSMNARLKTPTFDLTGVTDPRMKFTHWYNFERHSTDVQVWDAGNIKISTDGGATWSALASGTITPAYNGVVSSSTALNGQEIYSGILTQWESVVVDLGANLGGLPVDQVVLRFDAASDSSVQRPGWYIDAFRVGAAADLSYAPVITSTPPSTSLFAGHPFHYEITTTGAPAATVTVTGQAGSPLPMWLSFNPSTGVLSGTPENGDAGTATVVVSATNGELPNAAQTLTFTVTPVDVISGFTFEGDVNTPAVEFSNTTTSALTTGTVTHSFVTGSPGRAITTTGFHDSVNPNYYEFTITPDAGYQFIATELSFNSQRSNSGPTNYEVTMTVGAGTESPLTNGAGANGAGGSWALTKVFFTPAEHGPITEAVTFRIYGSGATGSSGTWRLDNLQFKGVATPQPMPAVITSTAVTTAVSDVLYTYTLTTSGYPAPTITTTGRPSWLTFDAATNTLSGTPTGVFIGTTSTIKVTANNGVGSSDTQTFTLEVIPGAALPLSDGSPLVENFGTATPTGWSFTNQWEFGIPTTGSATVGPPSLFDGEVAATKLDGNYSSSTTSRLQTPILDLTTVTHPQLKFVHWHNFEVSSTTGSRYDGANLKLSTDGGLTFEQLLPSSVVPAYHGNMSGSSLNGQQAWSGVLTDWTPVTVDLAANLAGKPLDKVVIRFDKASDATTQLPGWYVDAVKIGAAADL